MDLVLTAQDVRAVVVSLAASTLGLSAAEVAGFGESTQIDGEDLGADSISLMEAATQVSRFFRLHETGLEENLLRWRRLGDWVRTVMRSWEDSDEKRVAFLTSGSTGQPKSCTHEWRLLAQEVRALAEIFPDRRRIVGTVPRHHIYGFLWTVLLPRYLGVPSLEAQDIMPGRLIKSLEAGDLLVSLPLRWEQLSKAGLDLPRGVEGVTSTGPCPPEVISALRGIGLERMVEVYGSSETGGIGWREDPANPYRLLPYWSLTEDGERLVRQEPDGRLSDPIDAPDRLLQRPGGFVVAGRRDYAVQVGGVNVFPERVAWVIRSHPEVADCEVRPMRPEEGQRLKAFVVLNEETRNLSEARKRLENWLRTELSIPERPVSLTFGAVMPHDEQGKTAGCS